MLCTAVKDLAEFCLGPRSCIHVQWGAVARLCRVLLAPSYADSHTDRPSLLSFPRVLPDPQVRALTGDEEPVDRRVGEDLLQLDRHRALRVDTGGATRSHKS